MMQKRPVGELVRNQRILSGTADMTVAEASRDMCDAKVGSLMIVEAGQLIGIFTE